MRGTRGEIFPRLHWDFLIVSREDVVDVLTADSAGHQRGPHFLQQALDPFVHLPLIELQLPRDVRHPPRAPETEAQDHLIFRRGVASKAKFAAVWSLLLWTGVVWAARGPATIKDIMHSMVDPSGDFLFQSVQTIADEHGIREIAPHTDGEWENVRERLMVLVEAPNLLQGRRAARPTDRSKNPQVENQPEEIQELLNADPSTFIRRAQKLQDVASVAMKAVDAKDKDALLLGLDGIDKACESCHLRYWYPKDKRAQEAAKQDGVVE